MRRCRYCNNPDSYLVLKLRPQIDPNTNFEHKGPRIVCGSCDAIQITAAYAAEVKDLPGHPSAQWLRELRFINECEAAAGVPQDWETADYEI